MNLKFLNMSSIKFWGCDKKLKKLLRFMKKNKDNFELFVKNNINKIKKNKKIQ